MSEPDCHGSEMKHIEKAVSVFLPEAERAVRLPSNHRQSELVRHMISAVGA